MDARYRHHIRPAAVLMLSLTAACWAADQFGVLTGVRMAVHNAVNPGRLAVLSLAPPSVQSADNSEAAGEIAELQNALLVNELQRRQLLLDNARLQRELRDERRTASLQTVNSSDLVNFIALKARVLSHSRLPGQLKNAIIDAGRTQGLKESDLVISQDGIIVDKGTDHRLEEGDKVAYGAAIIGRITQLSRWVSLVQPITDSNYTGAVQLVQLSDQGATLGARGLLEGSGKEFCRVTGIPYTEAVSVGDEVFASSVQGINSPRLYYGQVVHAVFSEGGQWDIIVRPAFNPALLDEVAIVKPRLSRQRTQRNLPDKDGDRS
ncbi:MAG: hypothetical protein NXI04_11450 [Planctomycetaceae bacterium]|nr:hypothetical protein [Planctomycetaceae bacterium]